MASKAIILQSLKRMRDYYGKEPRPAVIDAYVRVLGQREDVEDDDLQRAVDMWIEREDWFPDRVSKFVRHLEDMGQEKILTNLMRYWLGIASYNNDLAGRKNDAKMVEWTVRNTSRIIPDDLELLPPPVRSEEELEERYPPLEVVNA